MRQQDRFLKILGPCALAMLAAIVVNHRPAVAAEGRANGLRAVADFAVISDQGERSVALFTEAAKVLLHPRCINCHPAGDVPLQGEAGGAHEPPVQRGNGGFGVVGMRCNTCHLLANYDPGRVPGAPMWHLAPPSMAWEGLSLAELCAQLKDPERTGGRDLRAVAEHMAEDELVAWGWDPGVGREPAPGTQKELDALIRAWIETGAVCPSG